MALLLGAMVGPQVQADSANPSFPISTDRTSSLRVIESNGPWLEQARLGNLFTYSTPAAGVTVPIYNSTTQQCVLFNPVNNTKAGIIKSIKIGYVSGTQVAGHYVIATQTLATNAITGTQTALVQSNKIVGNVNAAGQNGQSLQLFTAATVVAFTYLRPLRISQFVPTAAAVAAPWIYDEETNGSLVIMPGGAIAIASNVAAAVVAAIAIEVVEVLTSQVA